MSCCTPGLLWLCVCILAGWPGNLRNPSVSTSPVLGLQAWATTPGHPLWVLMLFTDRIIFPAGSVVFLCARLPLLADRLLSCPCTGYLPVYHHQLSTDLSPNYFWAEGHMFSVWVTSTDLDWT